MNTLKWYKGITPEPGSDKLLCSKCEKKIDEEEFPVRLWKQKDPNYMAVLHEKCFIKIYSKSKSHVQSKM